MRASTWHADGLGFDPRVQQSSFVDYEIISTVNSLHTADSSRAVVSSYWRNVVHLVLVNHLGSLPRNSVVRLTDHLDMTIVIPPQNIVLVSVIPSFCDSMIPSTFKVFTL